MTNFMSDPACIIDVPATINRKHVKLRLFSDHVDVWFDAQDAHCTIKRENIECIMHMQEMSRMAICFCNDMLVVPNTKRAVPSVVLHDVDLNDDQLQHLQCVRASSATETACGRYVVSHDPTLAVWSDRACTVIPQIEHVVLQRTKGGMSTFDAHILPHDLKPIVTVELLTYDQKVIDHGADPISCKTLEQARREPNGLQHLGELLSDYSDSEISDDESYCNSDQQYSTESDIGDFTESEQDDMEDFVSDTDSSQSDISIGQFDSEDDDTSNSCDECARCCDDFKQAEE